MSYACVSAPCFHAEEGMLARWCPVDSPGPFVHSSTWQMWWKQCEGATLTPSTAERRFRWTRIKAQMMAPQNLPVKIRLWKIENFNQRHKKYNFQRLMSDECLNAQASRSSDDSCRKNYSIHSICMSVHLIITGKNNILDVWRIIRENSFCRQTNSLKATLSCQLHKPTHWDSKNMMITHWKKKLALYWEEKPHVVG